MSVRAEAQCLIRDLQNGGDTGVDFAQLYRSFSIEIVQLIDDLAKFELKEDNLATFKAVKKMYNALNAEVGEYCIDVGRHFGVFREDLERYMDPRNQADNQKYLDHAVAYLKGKAQGTADASPRVVAIAEGSTLIAKKLVDVLEKLSNLILDLEKDPRYQKEKFHSITMGITGVLILAGGLLVIFTPMFWVCPFMIEHGGNLMIIGGAVATIGAVVTYKGFSKTLLDSSIKAAIQEYLNTKLKNIERMKMPVLDFNEYATKLQQFVESEIPGGVTEVSLAGYIESFEIMRATYMNEQPALGLKQKVNRFLEKRAPLLLAMTGASAVTCSASVVASRVRSLLAPELYAGIISDQCMHT